MAIDCRTATAPANERHEQDDERDDDNGNHNRRDEGDDSQYNRCAVLGGAVFAFIYSFDEVVVALFLSGIGLKTLPVRMWEVIRLEFTPVVAVAATAMIVLAGLVFLLARLAEARRNAGP